MIVSSTRQINVTLENDEAMNLVEAINDLYKDIMCDKKDGKNIDTLLFLKDSIVREIAK